MHNLGLTKLQEECGELVQASAKLASMLRINGFYEPYVDSYTHHDGHDLKAALEDEIADVRAATRFVIQKHLLDLDRIRERTDAKLALFEKWDADEA